MAICPHGTEIRTEFDCNWNINRLANRPQYFEIALLDVATGQRNVGWNEVDI
jgi:hypothetical protein